MKAGVEANTIKFTTLIKACAAPWPSTVQAIHATGLAFALLKEDGSVVSWGVQIKNVATIKELLQTRRVE